MKNKRHNISPIEVGIIHFIGIGGIGMSGIAEILFTLGYEVQGSDASPSYVTDNLEAKGIKVNFGQREENITNAALIVKSTAIKDDNPEIIAAKKLGIPIIKRAEMLAELMRFKHCIAVSGTHGKTTTTSLIAKMLFEAGLQPSVINGGVINELKTNAHWGEGEFLVAEADESDGTFIKIPAFVGVITNIDPEHLDYWGDFEKAKEAYIQFVENLPFYGFGVLCFDHQEVRNIAQKILDKKIYSYSLYGNPADIMAFDVKETTDGSIFNVRISERLQKELNNKHDEIRDIELSMHGEHNVQNALSAIVIALKLKVKENLICKALSNFQGVKRRFTKVAEIDEVLIIDDYAHHPAEIIATLKTAKNVARMRGGKVIVIAQPHRYSRLKGLFDEFANCFNDADILCLAEVYPAGEQPIDGVSSTALLEKIKSSSNPDAILLHDEEKIAEILNKVIDRKDIILFLGAGSITKWAYAFPDQLLKYRKMVDRVAV